ncbi:conserved Plasmodium protein, unknown function [Plasmodium gallinaceum]|uniref:Uncharacterized protein n=1 Tax=Plasmodium gallinaceum TaxID=5849 RepID=A0A1J1GRK6_PLAGA|nr:conserved Plasmodium protein, unknown function [Plasmodium gallinaceum]CRG95058.1 conserved Plasmodium protein, unknown function [Plasmodium gallinaceum]
MNLIKKKIINSIFLKKWLHNNLRFINNFKNVENCLNDIKTKGKDINVLSLVISNNNLCYCLFKNKIIKKIGLINIKKDIYSYDENSMNTKKKKNYIENVNKRYNYDKDENPLSFNIREILTILNFIKIYSNKEENDSKEGLQNNEDRNSEIINNGNSYKNISKNEIESNNEHINVNEFDNFKDSSSKKKKEWIIGIEKVNEKYEKNRIKEKILSIIVYFMQSIFKCKIIFFCPKEARKYFSNKCNYNLTNREEAYIYIKNKIKNFPKIDENNNSLNCLFSDCYIISFYTYRYYMHELIKNNRKIFNYLEKEVRKNKSFNHILQTLKKTENEKSKNDLRGLLKDRINRIIENEAYKLVDKYIV